MYSVEIKWHGRDAESMAFDTLTEAKEEYNQYLENASSLGLDYLTLMYGDNTIAQWHWYDDDNEN